MSHCEAQIAHYWCGLGNNAIIVFDFGLNIYIYISSKIYQKEKGRVHKRNESRETCNSTGLFHISVTIQSSGITNY